MPWSTSNNHPNPQLTTNTCSKALERFVRDPSLLAVATEASSHPSGLESLYAQPYVYSGGGLGNIEECPLQTCLAGGTSRDSITFAAVCVPAECTALDLSASDFCASLELVSEGVNNTISEEYLTLHKRIAEVGKFLGTGWTCGEYHVPWDPWTAGPYVFVATIVMVLAVVGTYVIPRRHRRNDFDLEVQLAAQHHELAQEEDYQEEKKEQGFYPAPKQIEHASSFWSAWNMVTHFEALGRQRQDTAALDGLRVASILWVIFGHLMAIQSSSGGGYNNPADFLPPHGFTTTWQGQLLFASRFAVDTFLLISGYLVVHVLTKLNPRGSTDNVWKQYVTTVPGLLMHRLLRILPLYGMTLGFYTQIAPHLGSGPFWHQWEGLLEPCREYGWTNLLFINNFVPFDKPNTATCFYHSWYLAVDVQLFILAPLLVYTYKQNARHGKLVTSLLLGASIGTTMYLAWVRKWSLNTFDGAGVARFDVEAYAKPHVRAQVYLAGMLLSMKHQRRRNGMATWKHRIGMFMALLLLAIVTFGTVTGAYVRRPCRYTEWPMLDDCGSIWSPEATFWYAATSRAAWAFAVCVIVDLCIRQRGGAVGAFLSLKCWTPLSHLSFGAYLVHPIVIFVWQLGNTQKETFRFLETGMNYVAVCVVSFGAALLLVLVVEFPCAALTKLYVSRRYLTRSSDKSELEVDMRHLLPKMTRLSHHYGSLECGDNEMHHR